MLARYCIIKSGNGFNSQRNGCTSPYRVRVTFVQAGKEWVRDFILFSSSEIQFDTTFLSINNNKLHTQVVVVGPSRTLVVSNRTGNNDESNTRRASEY